MNITLFLIISFLSSFPFHLAIRFSNPSLIFPSIHPSIHPSFLPSFPLISLSSWSPNVTGHNLIETGEIATTTVLLLPLKGKEDGHDTYVQYQKGNFDLSRDHNAE